MLSNEKYSINAFILKTNITGSLPALVLGVHLGVDLGERCDFFLVNFNVFYEYFPKNPPARSTVQVSALPMNARVEIEAIGLIQ